MHLHLARVTIWKSDKTTRKDHTQESQEVIPLPAGDHKAARYRQDSITQTQIKDKYQNDPQKKYRLGTVSKKTGVLKHV